MKWISIEMSGLFPSSFISHVALVLIVHVACIQAKSNFSSASSPTPATSTVSTINMPIDMALGLLACGGCVFFVALLCCLYGKAANLQEVMEAQRRSDMNTSVVREERIVKVKQELRRIQRQEGSPRDDAQPSVLSPTTRSHYFIEDNSDAPFSDASDGPWMESPTSVMMSGGNNPYVVLTTLNPGFVVPPYLLQVPSPLHPPPSVMTLDQRLEQLTYEQRQKVEEVTRMCLERNIGHHFDEWAIVRYCIARDYHVEKTIAMLQKSAKWIDEKQPATMICRFCRADPGAHMQSFVGWDLQHRPIAYSCFKHSTSRDKVEGALEHTVELAHHLISLMPQGVEQWVFIIDFTGFAYTVDGSPRVAIAFLGVMADHFPERLGLYICVDPPKMFWVFWKAISPFLDQKTKGKIIFTYTKSKPMVTEVFAAQLPPQVSDYLLTQFERNRST